MASENEFDPAPSLAGIYRVNIGPAEAVVDLLSYDEYNVCVEHLPNPHAGSKWEILHTIAAKLTVVKRERKY